MYANSYYNGRTDAIVRVMDELIENIEPLLFKYRVNLAVWAHYHSYQRHSAVYQNKMVQKSVLTESGVYVYKNPQATVHMVIATAGADFSVYDAGTTIEKPFPNGNPSEQWYSWSEIFFYRYGYSRITAINSTNLDITWTDSADGTVHDHSMIVQPAVLTGLAWNQIGVKKSVDDFPLDKSAEMGDVLGIWIASINALLLALIMIYVSHLKK